MARLLDLFHLCQDGLKFKLTHYPLLTERDLQDIRAQLEAFKTVTAISEEMRDVIETEWPDLAAKLLPPRDAQ